MDRWISADVVIFSDKTHNKYVDSCDLVLNMILLYTCTAALL